MISNDDDVYVGTGSITEVHRGPHCTVAQAFGEDWTGAPCVHLHGQAFTPPPSVTSSLVYGPEQPSEPAPELRLSACVGESARFKRWGWTVPFLFSCGVVFVIWFVMKG